jgi:hypothetical protein
VRPTVIGSTWVCVNGRKLLGVSHGTGCSGFSVQFLIVYRCNGDLA